MAVSLAVVVVATFALTSCFSFESGGMISFSWGLRSGTTTIKRHASRDLAFFAAPEPTRYRRGRAAATILASVTKDVSMPDIARDRWKAAIAPDQYQDIGEDILTLAWESRCLAMRAKAGWVDWGYDWFTYASGEGGCTWGRDPVPGVP